MNELADASLPAELTFGRALRLWAPHLLALAFPLTSLAFVLTGPHRPAVGLLFVSTIAISLVWDRRSRPELRTPHSQMPAWPFDLLLVVLSILQVANVVLCARLFATQSLASVDTILAIVIVGSSSGYSGIVVSHELIHRAGRRWTRLGRLLLCTVMYEHFFTEHIRGHHVRVGTPDDPATARFGESFNQFYIRTVPAQFRSAWRLETARLGDVNMKLTDPRILKSRVLHGVLAEVGLAATLCVAFGPAALVVHLGQAWWASRALEVVNYFEHWGLSRNTKKVLPHDSWDTHSTFTYFALTGLSRHADHHAFATRPYQQLRLWSESPKLPRGYLAMFPLVLIRNRKFKRLMTEELKRCKLGPFREGAEVSA